MEERRIKCSNIWQKATPFAIHAPRFAASPFLWFVISTIIPPFWRNLDDTISPRLQIAPKRIEIGGLWILPTYANDRNILFESANRTCFHHDWFLAPCDLRWWGTRRTLRRRRLLHHTTCGMRHTGFGHDDLLS